MGGNSGRKVMPARSGSRLAKRRATAFKYAEYDGEVYRWPTNHTATGNVADMERWRSGEWGEVAYGTDIRAKVNASLMLNCASSNPSSPVDHRSASRPRPQENTTT